MVINCESLEKKIIDAINAVNNDHGHIDIMASVDYEWLQVKVALRDKSINYKRYFSFAMDVKAKETDFEDYVVKSVSDDYLTYAEAFKTVDVKSALHYEELSEEEYVKKLEELVKTNFAEEVKRDVQ